MYIKPVNIEVKGGALYYVIFVVFVLSAMTLLFVVYRSIKLKAIRVELAYFQRIDNLSSALSLYLSQPETYQNSSESDIILFDDTSSIVHITQIPYGLFDVITATTDYRGKTLRKSILAGKDPFRGDSIALYVPDQKQTLYASGETKIIGNAVIPQKGMQRASIEGKPLKEPNLIGGRISRSQSKLPSLSPGVVAKIELAQNIDSLADIAYNITKFNASSISNPYSEEVIWYWSEGDYQVSGIKAKGSIGFISHGTILLRNDAQLDGIIISASKVIIEDGFKGKVQVFAKDSLLVGPECKLDFPSVLCLYNDNVNPIYMKIGNYTTIEGVVLISQTNLSTQKPQFSIAEGATIKGQIYHRGIVELLGKIHGSLFCEGFYLKTKRAYYENHLLDNEIDFSKLPHQFVTVDFLNGYNDQVIDFIESLF